MKTIYLSKSPKNLELGNLEKKIPEISENKISVPEGYVWEYNLGIVQNPKNKLEDDLELIKTSKGLISNLIKSLSLRGVSDLYESLSDLNFKFLTYDSRVQKRKDLLLDSIKRSQDIFTNYLNDAKLDDKIKIEYFLSNLEQISEKISLNDKII